MFARMTDTRYGTMVVALKCKNPPFHHLRNADLVIGKDYRILKDRDGATGTISTQRLEELKAESYEVLILDEAGQIVDEIYNG